MQYGTFAWCDLSTFDMSQAQKFYKSLFGWSFHDQDGYAFCYKGNQQAAGLFPMPDKFVAINMPSFWMSYIIADDIEQSVAIAEANGGKVEVRPESFSSGKIALIRDPAGAGFTVYEGGGLPGRGGSHGRMVWNELIVSSLDLVKPFYEALFGWQIVTTESATRFDVHSADSQPITAIEVVDNSIKGREEFWGIYFAVKSLTKALKQVEAGGGSIVYGSAQDGSALVADPMGAHLFLTDSANASGDSADDATHGSRKGGFKWRTILGLILVYTAVFFDLSWVWGLLFLLWVLPDLSSGVTYFMEPVSRSLNPALFWIIVLTWIAMAVYVLLEGVF